MANQSKFIHTILLVALLLLGACTDNVESTGSSNFGDPAEETPICPITEMQVLNPSLNTTVPNGLEANLCDFGVFGWESFLYLVSPIESPSGADPSSGSRRFLSVSDYAQYEGKGQDSCQTTLPEADSLFRATFVATAAPTVGPEAGAGTIYSVEGDSDTGDNVILYNIRFSRSLCSTSGPNLPADLVEIKTAWRFLPDGMDRSRYYWQNVTLSDGKEATLAMIGFHLAQVTQYHPEMIWTTFEHVDNAPDCEDMPDSPPEPSAGWTMASDACARCLSSPTTTNCSADCTNLNQTLESDLTPPVYPLAAEPTEVCRVYPQGTRPDDPDADQNRANIVSVNEQVTGPSGFLSSLPDSDPQSVWKNYQMIGGIWFNTASDSDPPVFVLPVGGLNTDQQRGSIHLANTVMETQFQGGPVSKVPSAPTTSLNCFSCHNADNYNDTLNSNAPFGLSHIESYIHGD